MWVFSFFPFWVLLLQLTAVHGYENVEQESEKAQNTLWGKEHTVNHLKVIQSMIGLCTGAG